MPADIVTLLDCQSNYGIFKIPSANNPHKSYTVTFNGSEGPAHCTCPAYKYSASAPYDRTCKHIQWVWDHACFYNPQWRKGQRPVFPSARPVEYTYDAVVQGESCPACGGPVVAVRRAV